jgi:hypothetical protein
MLDGHFLQYCSEEQRNDKGLCVTAVTNVGSALKFCSPTLQDNTTLVKMALKADGTNISFASPRLQGDSECVELALKGLPSFSMKWEAVQLAAKIYAKDHQALKDAPLSLRGDVEVIKVVVQVDGLGIKHAMPMVKKKVIDPHTHTRAREREREKKKRGMDIQERVAFLFLSMFCCA